MERISLNAIAGITIFSSTGATGNEYPDRMSTVLFYKAVKGSKISLLNTDYYFNIATYSLDFDDKYIYTYAYKEDQSWTTYNNDLEEDTYRQEDYIFSDEVYFRICVKRADGKNITEKEAEEVNNILLFISVQPEYCEKEYFKDEIQKTVNTILEKRKEKSLVLAVLSDPHVTVNGTWEDTANNIKEVHTKVNFDGIVHLGDFTDGMLPAIVTKTYVEMAINALKENHIPLYAVIGNHDTNYFRKNLEPLSEEEQYIIYQSNNDTCVERDSCKTYYYKDFDNISLRCIYLTSFDYQEKLRYGFSDEILVWLKQTLDSTPLGSSVVIFSHEAPLAILDYWTSDIRNEDKLMTILETYNSQNGRKIMAFIHGHTHADYVYTERGFPIVSIGCAKCEYFTDKKPEGSFTCERSLGTVTQDLWDTVIITPSENRIDFIRFGAGEDRIVFS